VSVRDAAFDGRLVALGYLYLTAQNILSTLIGVLGYAFLTRSLSQVDVGAISGLTLLTTLFSSSQTLSSSIAKFVSELRDRGRWISSYPLSLIFRLLIASSYPFYYSSSTGSLHSYSRPPSTLKRLGSSLRCSP